MSQGWGDDWNSSSSSSSTARNDSRSSSTFRGRPYTPGRLGRGRGMGYTNSYQSRPYDSHSRHSTAPQTSSGWGEDLGVPIEPINRPPKAKSPPPEEDFDDWSSAAEQCKENERKKWLARGPVIKNFYIESPEVTAMTAEQVDQFRRENNNISLTHLCADDDRPLLKPIINFADAFASYPEILSEIAKHGFEKPSPIQAQSWPILLSGYDLIGIAQTGTGKTLAYLLPALIHIDGQPKPREEREGPTALIIAPTRELAQQIEKEAKKYSYRNIRTLCIYGGGDRAVQIAECEKGIEIVIATPGRLCDLIDHNRLQLTCVTYMVLDEADKMLDMGFEPEIRKIIYQVNPNRQTVLMSATWPPMVRSLAMSHTQKPFQIYINTLDLAAVTSVSQEVIILPADEKPAFLESFVRSITDEDKAIVFFGRKATVNDATATISLKGLVVQSMHGDRDQISREEALSDLREGHARVLFATDLASRGLDVENVTHVLNYDFPRDIEEYVHRVGRSGRAGKRGKSITLVTKEDWRHAGKLIEILERASQPVPDELCELAKGYKEFCARREAERALNPVRGGRGGGRGGNYSRPRW